MEQKKLLWVIFSAVGFVFIIAVAGLVFFWPRDKETADDGGKMITGLSRDFDPVEWVREDQEYPGIEDETEGEGDNLILVYGESKEGTTTGETDGDAAGKAEDAAAAQNAGKSEGATADETSQKISTGKDGVEIEIYQPKAGEQKVTAEPAAEKEPEEKTRSERLKEYWIQAGSYTSMVRADEVKQELSEKGIASVVTTKTVNSTDYYRVRIGPYGSKAEAEKFLSWIRSVQGFESSYVSMVYVTRRLN